MIGTRHFHALLAPAFAAALLCGASASAHAQSAILDTAKTLLGLDEEKVEPVYRERAPLVVPPKLTLREPQKKADPVNWPKDPDVVRAKAAAMEAKKPVPFDPKPANVRPLTIEEMRAGRVAGAGIPDANSPKPSNRDPDSALSVEDIRKQVNTAQATPTAQRRYLTDPPNGLTKPAPGAPVEAPKTGVSSVVSAIPNPLDIFRSSSSE